MKILVHDYAGHPFQMQLSVNLASRGAVVTHAYFAGDQGPKGSISESEFANGGSVRLAPLGQASGYSKSRLFKRILSDLAYQRVLTSFIRQGAFDIVISGNTPLWIQGSAIRATAKSGGKFVFWCQDFYSIAVSDFLRSKVGVFSAMPSLLLRAWDQMQMRASTHIVHITPHFIKQTDAWGISQDRISVIPNWGAINEIDVCGHQNEWQEVNVASDKPVVLYSGTLGLKHNPSLIDEAANALPAEFVVVGFGVGYEELSRKNNKNLKLLPLQPFDVFPKVLGTATVLIAVIEREAGSFSVPSKVLSYLCAGRPIVLAAPADNLASSIIRESGAGLVVEPEDSQGFTEAIGRIIDDPELARSMGKAGRRYAEQNFDIDIVTSRFEEVFEEALGRVK